MNQSPKRQQVIVGLFVAVAITILAGGILTVGDLNDSFARKITVTAIFPEVSGLKKGDNIWFSGVKIGMVTKLAFRGEGEVEVEMKIDQDAVSYLHDDTIAKIGSDGLIGNRIVVLYGGTPRAPVLADGDVLATGMSVSTEEIMAVLQENNANVLEITGRLTRGEGTLGKLLVDEEIYASLKETVGTLGVASESAKDLTASLAVFSEKLNREGSLPNDLVTDQTMYPALKSGVGKLEHASDKASELLAGLAEGAANPNTPISTLMHDESAGTDLKVTFENLSESSSLLAEDLEALQHTFLLKHFFKKKARAEKRAAAKAASGDR